MIEKDWLTRGVRGSTRISPAGMPALPGISALVRNPSPSTHRSLFFLCLAINLYAHLAVSGSVLIFFESVLAKKVRTDPDALKMFVRSARLIWESDQRTGTAVAGKYAESET